MSSNSETARRDAPRMSAVATRFGAPVVSTTVTLLLLVSACSADTATDPSAEGPPPATGTTSPPATATPPASATPPATATPTAEPGDAPDDSGTGGEVGGRHAATVDGAVVEGGEIGGIYTLADVRVGRHEGFTRIVWEMEEAAGQPYHRVVTRVRPDGAPDEPFGRHWLEISISDVYAWTRPELLQAREVDEVGAVTAIRSLMIGDDAIYAVGVALTGPARFDVTLLEAPVRLVLDVHDEG